MYPKRLPLNFNEDKVRDTRWAKDDKPWAPPPITGQLSSSEAHWLFTKNLGPGNYAHLGVLRGLSAWCQLCGLKNVDSTLYCVDLWEPLAKLHAKCNNNDLAKFLEICKTHNFDKKIVACKGETSVWARRLADKKFNFVFIDADHSYVHAKEDWNLWSALVRPGGEVAFHDMHDDNVAKVISEIDLSKWEEVEGVYSIRSFRKR